MASSQKVDVSCPTGLPASNTKHNPNGREKKDPSFPQLSSMPVESQMEEMTTRCPCPVSRRVGGMVWAEVLRWAEGSRSSLPFDLCLSGRLALPSRGL